MMQFEDQLAAALRALLEPANGQHIDDSWKAWDVAKATLAAYDAARLPTHIPGANPPIPTPERIAACVLACEGIPTEQLKEMNSIDTGTLARAYDVCSVLWEWFGVELVGDHPINGAEAVEALCQVADDVEGVVQWARDEGEL